MASAKEKAKYHAKNYARLKALGLSDADIQAYKNIWGDHINDNEYNRIAQQWSIKQESVKQAAAALEARTPDFLKNDPSFQALPTDMKEIAVYNYEVQKANDKQKAEALSKALEMATEQADPYWKSIILVAQDEILRGFEQAQGDFNSSIERQQRIIENINQDLTTNKDFLSLEQQNELANLSRNYQINQENLVQGAAEQGLTFSTKRKLAEQRLAEANVGMVESTNRQYNKQLMDLQNQASRGTEEAQQEIEDLQRRISENTTSLGRKAETYLGTENLPSLPGYQPLGNITGDLYEEKVKDVSQRSNAIYNELTQASLNFS